MANVKTGKLAKTDGGVIWTISDWTDSDQGAKLEERLVGMARDEQEDSKGRGVIGAPKSRKQNRASRKDKKVEVSVTPGKRDESYDMDKVLASLGEPITKEVKVKKKDKTTKNKTKLKHHVKTEEGPRNDEQERTTREKKEAQEAADQEEVVEVRQEIMREQEEVLRKARVNRMYEEQVKVIREHGEEQRRAQEALELQGAVALPLVQGAATPLTHQAFLEELIAREAACLMCPVCREECSAPIYGCPDYHQLCATCRRQDLATCPMCRREFGAGGPLRNRFAEEKAEVLERLRRQLTN